MRWRTYLVDYLCMEVFLEKDEEELRVNLCYWNSKRVRVKEELEARAKEDYNFGLKVIKPLM
jgi:hypothetical protein